MSNWEQVTAVKAHRQPLEDVLTQQPDRIRNNTLFHCWPTSARDEVIAAAAGWIDPEQARGLTE